MSGPSLPTAVSRLRQVPPLLWIALVAAAGLAFLTWHRYAGDDTDTDWTTPKETQAPPVAPFPGTPAAHGTGSPMSCNPGFRSRVWPGNLGQSATSIIGGWGAH